MPKRVPPEVRQKIGRLISQGYTYKYVAAETGVSESFIKQNKFGHADNGEGYKKARSLDAMKHPIPLDKLCPEAKRALEDPAYFALRYFGSILKPWHTDALNTVAALMDTPDEEYVVVNCPPGAGKSHVFGLILPAWLTCRRRDIRGMIVSNATANANKELVQLRRVLDEPQPARASSGDIALNIAVDAEASLMEDYGLFRSGDGGDKWAQNAFQVMPMPGYTVTEKETTWQSYGKESRFLGNRLDFIIADDAWDKSALKTAEAKADTKEWWDNFVESRLEPGGLLLLVGQRQSADDLYRYCVDKIDGVDEDDEDIEDLENAPRMYHHIMYQAHYPELCTGVHGVEAKAYPEGCLLYPERLRWKKLRGFIARNDNKWHVEYQQGDIANADVLVNPLWVTGGKDPETNVEYVGCLDEDRQEWEVPKNFRDGLFVWAAIDPSPTKYWSIQCWGWHPATEQRFLIAHFRGKMDSPDLLDWNMGTGEYTGIMHEWQRKSRSLDLQIKYWIVENNAAQKFMLTSDTHRKWQITQGVQIVRHDTYTNKQDPILGIQSLKGIWREGKVRLPWAGLAGRTATSHLVNEVTKWPEGGTDDAVMAQWFGEFNLPTLYMPPHLQSLSFKVPSWTGGRPLRSVG